MLEENFPSQRFDVCRRVAIVAEQASHDAVAKLALAVLSRACSMICSFLLVSGIRLLEESSYWQ